MYVLNSYVCMYHKVDQRRGFDTSSQEQTFMHGSNDEEVMLLLCRLFFKLQIWTRNVNLSSFSRVAAIILLVSNVHWLVFLDYLHPCRCGFKMLL